MRKLLAAGALLVLAAAAAVVIIPQPGLRVELLDVSGYTDDVPAWMPFRVTLGISNDTRTPVSIRRIAVEPDLDEFNEATGGGGVLEPPLRIAPGNRASYQAAATLLNANQLQEGTYALVFRVRLEHAGGTDTYSFPAELVYTRNPKTRVLR